MHREILAQNSTFDREIILYGLSRGWDGVIACNLEPGVKISLTRAEGSIREIGGTGRIRVVTKPMPVVQVYDPET